jgi:hypothetical protein
MPSTSRSLAAAVLAASVLLASPGAASAAPIEGYAEYDPQTKCARKAKPGTKVLGRWLDRRGGYASVTTRSCRSGGVSEHKDGRAIDWMLDARRKQDRRVARAFLRLAFATDAAGNAHAKARRMGIMYVIWNDHMYAAWDGFERERYLSSSCKTRKRCSATLRHRNHVHISLSTAGARGATSWYDGRIG